MRRFLRLAAGCAVLAGVVLTMPAYGAPARWSFERASLGIDAKAALTDAGGSQTSAFLPGAYISYSLTSNLSAAATIERDFVSRLTIGRAGLRFPIARLHDGDGRLAAGVNLVAYGDEGSVGIPEPTSWDASLNGSWKVASAKDGATTFWGIASASYDPENTRATYRLGIRWQAIGGAPWRAEEGL